LKNTESKQPFLCAQISRDDEADGTRKVTLSGGSTEVEYARRLVEEAVAGGGGGRGGRDGYSARSGGHSGGADWKYSAPHQGLYCTVSETTLFLVISGPQGI
jgi:hypothetical protein